MPRSASLIRILGLLLCVIGLFGCDHATKIAAKATLEGAPAMPVAPSVLHGAVELQYVENPDIAFNTLRMLHIPRSPAILIAISGVAILSLAIMAMASWRRRKQLSANGEDAPSSSSSSRNEERVAQTGMALVLGGALGNIVDRIVRGYVVDFIHVKGWPVFNVADIAVVVGMILMILPRLRRKTSPPAPPPSPTTIDAA